MKKIFYLLTAFSLALTNFSCKKVLSDPRDYYPKVNTVSAIVLSDGSVEVKGEIISEGETPVEYEGFCMDTLPVPDMLANQMLAGSNGNNFSAIYSGFHPYKKYYFRSWAANENGYSYGNVIALDSIQATPVVAPCTLATNFLSLTSQWPNETIYMVGAPDINSWEFNVSTGSTNMTMRFGELPRTGIYSTRSTMSPSPPYVSISFWHGSVQGSVEDGYSLYVNQLSPTSWEMTLCDGGWDFFSTTLHLKMKFICPL